MTCLSSFVGAAHTVAGPANNTKAHAGELVAHGQPLGGLGARPDATCEAVFSAGQPEGAGEDYQELVQAAVEKFNMNRASLEVRDWQRSFGMAL